MASVDSTLSIHPITGQRVVLLPLDLGVLKPLHHLMQLEPYPFSYIPRDKYNLEGYLNREMAHQQERTNLPYSIWDHHNTFLGVTHVQAVCCPFTGEIKPFPHSAEISGTVLAPFAQRKGYNTEAKLLLLSQLFEQQECERVWFNTHQHNHRCRTSLANLGATFEGFTKLKDAEHNTAVFSIIDNEWPAVRQHLQRKLNQHIQA